MSDEPIFEYRPSKTRHLERALWFWLLPVLVVVAAAYALLIREVPADGLGGALLGSIAIAGFVTLLGRLNDQVAKRSLLALTDTGELVVEKHRPPPFRPVRLGLDTRGATELSVSSDQDSQITLVAVRGPGEKRQRTAIAGAMNDSEIEGLFRAMQRFSPDLRVGWQIICPIQGKQWLLFGRHRLRERALTKLVRRLDDYRAEVEARKIDLKVITDAVNNRVRIEVVPEKLAAAREIFGGLNDARYEIAARGE